MKRTRTVRSNSKTNSKELNTEALTVIVKDNETGKILVEEKAGSIVFAAVIDTDKEGQVFNAGIAGEFNLNSLMQSVEVVADTTAQALKDAYDADAEDFLNLMGKAVSSAATSNFSKEDQAKAVLKGIIKMASKSKKNNGEVH